MLGYYIEMHPDLVLDASYPEADDRVIRNLDEFRRAADRHADLYLVSYSSHMDSPAFVSPDVREYVLDEMRRIDDQQDDKRIMVFTNRQRTGN